MPWFELIVAALYVQAFLWYGRLSYVQGVLDRHYDARAKRVRHVLEDHRASALPVRSFYR
jgi:hypothetical protein